MSASPDLKGLAAMSSLGPASARMLIEAGVPNPDALRAIGVEDAYRRLRFTHGGRATTTFIYAVDAAISGGHWAQLAPARQVKLRAIAQRIQTELAAIADRPDKRRGKHDA